MTANPHYKGNGCGPKGWKFKIPTWHLRAACDNHDHAYFKGGTEKDRELADYIFYDSMRRQARAENIWRRIPMLYQAWVFYRSVRVIGKDHFNYHG